MLEIKNITADRGGKRILEGAELSVRRGEITALIGRNGCGKSTLCECINGSLGYDGEIICGGKNLAHLSGRERARLISFLPQLLSKPHITVSELVAFGRNPYRAFFAQDDKIDADSEPFGIAELRNRFLDEISGGELRRAYLAMTFARKTPFVILDEPFAHMDAAFEHSFRAELSRIGKESGILVVMHDINAAVRLADRIAILDDGKIRFEGETRDSYDAIEKIFGIRKYISGENVFFAP